MQGEFTLVELCNGCLKSCLTVTGSSYTICRVILLYCILVVLNLAEVSQALAEQYAEWLYSSWTVYWVTWLWWIDCSWAVFLMTFLLEHFGECTIRVTVLLEYLDHAFLYVVAFCFITHWSYILFFFPLLGAFSYAYSTLTTIFNFVVCMVFAKTLNFLITQNWSRNFYQGWVRLHISAVSYSIDF